MSEKTILVVYFTLDGNTRKVASIISKQLDADILELKLQQQFPRNRILRFLTAGKQTVFKATPLLEHGHLNLDQYKLIFLGTPVWAGNFSSPVRSFINYYDFQDKEMALFCTHQGYHSGALEKLEAELKNRNTTILAKIDLASPEKRHETSLEKEITQYIEQVLNARTNCD